MKIKAIIFDADNTLIASHTFVRNVLKLTIKELRLKAIDDKTLREVQKKNLPFEKIFHELFHEQSESVLEEYRKQAKPLKFEAIDHALQTIKDLTARKITLCILTNRTRMLHERLQESGFSLNDFAIIKGPTSEMHTKPHPSAYQEILKELFNRGFKKEEILAVGDHPDDYLPAKAEQIIFIAVLTGLSTKQDFLDHGLDGNYVIENLSQLTRFI